MSVQRPRFLRKSKAVLAGTALAASAVAGLGLINAAPAQAWPSPNVDFTGHGYGHGRGMGQWGAYGYATDYGWTYTQILAHYYGGTTLKAVAPSSITVDLSSLDGSGSVTITSGAAFTAAGVSVPAHGAAKITYISANAYNVQINAGGCTKPVDTARRLTNGAVRSSVAVPTSLSQMLTVCNTNRTYRGSLTLTYGSGATRLVNTLSMDDYLRGTVPRESPASWGDAANGKGMAALQAQAVAARSYAASSNRYAWARICDSQNCQVYGGAGLNGASIEDARTNTAVSSTSGKVLTNSAGTVMSAEYSSSTGGWTAGGTFPAVEDLGDKEAPDHNWSATMPATTVGSRFGVGTLTSIVMTRNGLGADGGRVTSVKITGSAGTDTETGSDFAYELGLKSDWFSVKTVAVPSYFYFANNDAHPHTDIAQPFGSVGDIPLACDWNGDGTDTAGVYRPSNETFYLRNTFAVGAPLTTVRLGNTGYLPLCGDWNGDGTDTVGVYDPHTATFYLLNTNARTPSSPLIQIRLGNTTYRPVAGDWNGDHIDTVGVYDPATALFYLLNTNSRPPGTPLTQVRLGSAAELPMAGDWNGDGKTTLGVFNPRTARWDLIDTLTPGSPQTSFAWGLPGDRPVAGDWNHDRHDTIAVARGF